MLKTITRAAVRVQTLGLRSQHRMRAGEAEEGVAIKLLLLRISRWSTEVGRKGKGGGRGIREQDRIIRCHLVNDF